jgi:hypothetical protein
MLAGVSRRNPSGRAMATREHWKDQSARKYPDSNRNKALLLPGLQAAPAEGDRPNLLILIGVGGFPEPRVPSP